MTTKVPQPVGVTVLPDCPEHGKSTVCFFFLKVSSWSALLVGRVASQRGKCQYQPESVSPNPPYPLFAPISLLICCTMSITKHHRLPHPHLEVHFCCAPRPKVSLTAHDLRCGLKLVVFPNTLLTFSRVTQKHTASFPSTL